MGGINAGRAPACEFVDVEGEGGGGGCEGDGLEEGEGCVGFGE